MSMLLVQKIIIEINLINKGYGRENQTNEK